MQTSLQEISEKAGRVKDHRFRGLAVMLHEYNLKESWRYIKKDKAAGVDGVRAREYEEQLDTNITNLAGRLKKGSYHAKLVKRQYIPKGKGKERPLGILATDDKLVQVAGKRILEAIHEPDFLDFSYGYRPGRGVKDALNKLTYELQFGWYSYVVEADIKGFFDHIDHDWLIKMLEHRINDKGFIRLIKKWLRAGILERDGKVIHPIKGTPQGGIISPVLANIYLHYVLDLWFDKYIRPRCQGEVCLVRYADDFVVLFRYKSDADNFYQHLPKRLDKFGLSLSQEKTRIIRFSKFRMDENKRFDFIGFEFYWGKDRKGRPNVKRRTSRKKFRKSLENFRDFVKEHRGIGTVKLIAKINTKLRGYYNHYGVIGNYDSLKEFYYHIRRILFKWLNRRSQRKSYNWQQFKQLLADHSLAEPRITQRRDVQLSFSFYPCRTR